VKRISVWARQFASLIARHCAAACWIALACLFLVAATAQTMLTPSQLANVPNFPSRYGFNCTTVGSSTFCEIDRAYILHLLPIPFDGTAVAPQSGACFDTGGVIVTNEPAVYFCARTFPGAPNLNWIRVQAQSTW
jgi:hypothetical protein